MNRSRPFARTVVAVAGASLVLAACGNSDSGGGGGGGGDGTTTGTTDTTIKIGTHQPLTGPAAPGYSEISPGVKAYFDHVNAEGGINGREIEYTVRDDGYNPSNTSNVVNQLVLQDEVFAVVGGLGTPTHSAVLDFLNEEEVPDLFVSSGALAWDNPEEYPYTFGWQPDYEIEGKVMGQYIKENFPDAKVGLYLQGDDLGRDGAKGIKSQIEDQIVSEVTYVVTDQSVAPQIEQLKNDGVDFVVGFNVPGFTARAHLAARSAGFAPTWFHSNVGANATLVGQLIASATQGSVTNGASLLNGVYTTSYIPTADQPDNPWVQKMTEVWEQYGSDKEIGDYELYGMYYAYAFVSALQAAGEDLSREGIVEAIEQEGSDWEGPWLAPLDYSEESHRGVSGVRIVQLEGGKAVEKTGIKLTDADDAPIEDFEGEQSTPTENGIPDVG